MLHKDKRCTECNGEPVTPTCALAQKRGAALLETNRIIAGWLEDWTARAERAQLCFEIFDLHPNQHEELLHEGRTLERIISVLVRESGNG
jgi:hypothetical protein